MELGLLINKLDVANSTGTIASDLARIAEAAERSGTTWLSVPDHFFQMPLRQRRAEDPFLECYTTLGYLAARTSQIQLGVLVTGVTYRHPGLLAKIATTLDVLSEGRATLGLGAAWYEREHHGLGVPFPPLAERFDRLEETLQICLQMWEPSNNGPFDGTYYQLAETICSPAPIATPHPPILIGGGGEKRTLRLVAKYANACHIPGSPTEVKHKLAVLRQHCDDVGRDYDDIEKTAAYTGEALERGDVDHLVAELAPFSDLGITKVIVVPPDDVNPSTWIDTVCTPTTPHLAQLP